MDTSRYADMYKANGQILIHSQARGRLYAVPAIDKYQVFASTREQINEVANAPIENLSFNAAVDEVSFDFCIPA